MSVIFRVESFSWAISGSTDITVVKRVCLQYYYISCVYTHMWMYIQNLQLFQEFKNLRIWFSAFVKGNHSHAVFLETPLHVKTARDVSKLPWHNYLKGQQSNIISDCVRSSCLTLFYAESFWSWLAKPALTECRGIALPTQNLHAGKWVVSARPRPLYLWKEPRYTLYRKLYEPRSRFRWVRRNSLPPGFEPRAVQPISSSYTDYVIMAAHDKYTPAKTKIVTYRFFLNIIRFVILNLVTVAKFGLSVICCIEFVRYFPRFGTNTNYSYSFSYCGHLQGRHYMVEQFLIFLTQM